MRVYKSAYLCYNKHNKNKDGARICAKKRFDFWRKEIWQDRVADLAAAEDFAAAVAASAEAAAAALAEAAALAAVEDSTADPRIITIIISAGDGAIPVRTDIIITVAAEAVLADCLG